MHGQVVAHNVWLTSRDAPSGTNLRAALCNPAALKWYGLSSAVCLMGPHAEYPSGIPPTAQVYSLRVPFYWSLGGYILLGCHPIGRLQGIVFIIINMHYHSHRW